MAKMRGGVRGGDTVVKCIGSNKDPKANQYQSDTPFTGSCIDFDIYTHALSTTATLLAKLQYRSHEESNVMDIPLLIIQGSS